MLRPKLVLLLTDVLPEPVSLLLFLLLCTSETRRYRKSRGTSHHTTQTITTTIIWCTRFTYVVLWINISSCLFFFFSFFIFYLFLSNNVILMFLLSFLSIRSKFVFFCLSFFFFFCLMSYLPSWNIQAKVIRLEEQSWYYLTYSWRNRGVHAFPKSIGPKVSEIAWLEFELTHFSPVHLPLDHRDCFHLEEVLINCLSSYRKLLNYSFVGLFVNGFRDGFWSVGLVCCEERNFSVNGLTLLLSHEYDATQL